jgi:hypothetical protein
MNMRRSELVAGREKDMQFVRILLEHKMIEAPVLRELGEALPIDFTRKEAVQQRLSGVEAMVRRRI